MLSFDELNRQILLLRTRYGAFWNLAMAFASLGLVTVSGVVMYMLIEEWNFVDSFYMVVITLSTVGYQEVRPLSEGGRMATSLLILGGVGSFMYIISVFSQILVEGKLHKALGRRRVLKMINSLKDHFIVCGYGRIGTIVVEQVQREGHPVVVIEKDPEVLERLEEDGILHIAGDATSDEILESAGLYRAKSLIAALSQEAANVYVTLTARQLNPDLTIIARAGAHSHIPRLERAGADRVVMPHVIGGMRMAQSVLRPSVTNLIELALKGDLELQMEEHIVSPDSEFVGKSLIESEIRPRLNVIIISIKKANGEFIFNPGPDAVIGSRDTLITVGKPESMVRLRELCSPGN